MILTRIFDDEIFDRALGEWTWLDFTNKKPIMSSLFGDLFFVGPDGYWFLSIFDGRLTREWPNRDALVAALNSQSGADEWLTGTLAMAADRRGVTLADGQVYAFAPHPVFTGKFDIGSIMALDLVVAHTVAGQALRP